jgi:hypothetical protein
VVLKEDLLMMNFTVRRGEGKFMEPIILTGVSYGKHQFSLVYPSIAGETICIAECKCGFQVEIIQFRTYGGIKDLQKKWEKHIGIWKGWI